MSTPSSKNIGRLTRGGSVARLTAADNAGPEPPLNTPTPNAAGSMSDPPSPGTVAAEPMASTGHSDEVSTFDDIPWNEWTELGLRSVPAVSDVSMEDVSMEDVEQSTQVSDLAQG
ncbi:hypothetical protein BG011_004483, partial [Mortierella polycephala]